MCEPLRQFNLNPEYRLTLFPTSSPTRENAHLVRSGDTVLLDLLREGEPKSIDDLKFSLGVTATAVRQRIERLLEGGLIERQKQVSGRGRPVYLYALTIDGHRHAGADSSEFAEAMWREIMALRDSPIRRRLISAVARRLGKMYSARLSSDGVALENRMRSLSSMMVRNQIAANVHMSGPESARLPVLDIGSCPYPTLRDHPDDRSLCKMEEEMLSEALGEPVHLTSCRLDGDHCCQFTPVTTS